MAKSEYLLSIIHAYILFSRLEVVKDGSFTDEYVTYVLTAPLVGFAVKYDVLPNNLPPQVY